MYCCSPEAVLTTIEPSENDERYTVTSTGGPAPSNADDAAPMVVRSEAVASTVGPGR